MPRKAKPDPDLGRVAKVAAEFGVSGLARSRLTTRREAHRRHVDPGAGYGQTRRCPAI